jgi:hypothetical protein
LGDLYFSRDATKRLPAILTGEAVSLGVCAAIAGALTDGVGALPCALVSGAAWWVAYKAGECAGKDMCLTMAEEFITECRGDGNCC